MKKSERHSLSLLNAVPHHISLAVGVERAPFVPTTSALRLPFETCGRRVAACWAQATISHLTNLVVGVISSLAERLNLL
jgi:hypothetical protein